MTDKCDILWPLVTKFCDKIVVFSYPSVTVIHHKVPKYFIRWYLSLLQSISNVKMHQQCSDILAFHTGNYVFHIFPNCGLNWQTIPWSFQFSNFPWLSPTFRVSGNSQTTEVNQQTHLPRGDSLTELLIDHDDNGQDVRVGRVSAVVWPQVVLHVLTELQQHHAVNGKTDTAHQHTHTVRVTSHLVRCTLQADAFNAG